MDKSFSHFNIFTLIKRKLGVFIWVSDIVGLLAECKISFYFQKHQNKPGTCKNLRLWADK